MLTSQMASLSHASIPTCLIQSATLSSAVMLRSSGTLPRRSRTAHQIRTIRTGLWYSHLDPNFSKALRRRNHAMKHKYLEAVGRKLAWDRRDHEFPRSLSLKGFMCSAWRGHDSRPGGRWINMDILHPEKQAQQRGGSSSIGIDPGLGGFDQLWRKNSFYELLQSRSRAYKKTLDSLESSVSELNLRSNNYLKRSGKAVYKEFHRLRSTPQSQFNTEANTEYEIDPITNRKVYKNQTLQGRKSIKIPTETYREPIPKSHGSKPPNYKPSRPNPVPIVNANGQHQYLDSARDSLRDYESRESHKPFFAYEPDGEPPEKPDAFQDGLKDFHKKASYKWFTWFVSPDRSVSAQSSKPCPVQEGLKEYDSRTIYEASSSVEPEVKVSDRIDHRDLIQNGLKEFDSKVCYGPVKAPGNEVQATTADAVEGALKDFDAKSSYGPVVHNEPDGKPLIKEDPKTNGLHEFDNKANYNPRRILKNISLIQGSFVTDRSFRYQDNVDRREDLDLLTPSDVRAASGRVRNPQKETEEEKLLRRKDLEADYQKPQSSEVLFADKLSAGVPIKESWQPVGSYETKKTARKLTGNFVRDFPEEFEVKWSTSSDSSGALQSNSGADSWGYDKTPKGLELSYQHEVENEVQKAEKEYIDGRASREAFKRTPDTPRLQTSLERGSRRSSENEDVDSAALSAARFEARSTAGHGLESSYADERQKQSEMDPYSKEPQGLETSYTNECRQETERDPYSKEPQGLETSYSDECAANQGEGDLSALVSSYGTSKGDGETSTVQSSSLDSSIEGNDGPAKASKHAAESSGEGEVLSRELEKIYEDKYGKIDLTHRQFSTASESAPVIAAISSPAAAIPEELVPTIYKILAYDPTMQSISTAETTSIVSVTASALTPAEVLLRLSNPSKFFPHFEPLQAEGYEIISGSGDVLVFRKVRAAGPPVAKVESAQLLQEATRKGINPIDGMQSIPIAATGNFASPTGFVNYDRPESSDPPFKSNIDVRREEPVFSGKSSWNEETEPTQRKKSSLTKRVLLGGAMVGGCSYAIGVVAEFFKSGGIDGLGPKGF